MHTLDFFFPLQAARSVNAPARILREARVLLDEEDCGRESELKETARVFQFECKAGEQRDLEMLMDWLESEGLWYIWREGQLLKRTYLTGVIHLSSQKCLNAA